MLVRAQYDHIEAGIIVEIARWWVERHACGHVVAYGELQSTTTELSARKGSDSGGDYHQLHRFRSSYPPNDLSSISANNLGQRGVGEFGIGDDPWTNGVVRQETGTGMPAGLKR